MRLTPPPDSTGKSWHLPSGLEVSLPAGNAGGREIHSQRDVEFLLSQGWTNAPQSIAPPAPGPLEVVKTLREKVASQNAQDAAGSAGVSASGPKVLMLPPLTGPGRALSREGRPYVAKDNAPVEALALDVPFLTANDWTVVCSLGPIPARARRGHLHRLPNGNLLIFDGTAWRGLHKGEVVNA